MDRQVPTAADALLGRRPYPGRAVQRTGGIAWTAPRGVAALRRAGERQGAGRGEARPGLPSPAGRGAGGEGAAERRRLAIRGAGDAPLLSRQPSLRPRAQGLQAACGLEPRPRRSSPRLLGERGSAASRHLTLTLPPKGEGTCFAAAGSPAVTGRPTEIRPQAGQGSPAEEARPEAKEAGREEDQGLRRLLRLPRGDSGGFRRTACWRSTGASGRRCCGCGSSRDLQAMVRIVDETLVPPGHPHADYLRGCARDALSRLILPQPGAGDPPRADRPCRDPRGGRVRQEPPQSPAAAAGPQPPPAGRRSRLPQRLQAGRARPVRQLAGARRDLPGGQARPRATRPGKRSSP